MLPEPGPVKAVRNLILQGDQDQIQLQLAQTQLGYRREMNKLFREPCADQIGSRESGEPGLTQQLVLLTRINGLTSMWESQSDYCVQIAKVQSGLF